MRCSLRSCAVLGIYAWAALVATVPAQARAAAAPTSAADRARKHYEEGVHLFEAGEREEALFEFQLAQEILPSDYNLFMFAQCEYHLGRLKEALVHYQQFLERRPEGREAELARLRIHAIKLRPGIVAINTEPPGVEVRLEGPTPMAGQAPNQFPVQRGRYRLVLSKTNHVTKTTEVEIEAGETLPLFFQLSPSPARLEIRTRPPNATLYVRGTRAQNPYAQQVEPGRYEIYAEATHYLDRREVFAVGPGETRKIDFALEYVQRSGRPELIWFWTAAGAIIGGAAIIARLEGLPNERSATLVAAAGVAGGIAGGVVSAALVPGYIRDNLAMFRIGAQWVGAVEGAAIGMTATGSPTASAGWLGGALGLGAGAALGTWLDDRAPNYGRVAMVQSAAGVGTLAGALAAAAFKPDSAAPDYFQRAVPLGVLAGLNLGLGAGLAMAYLPDQRAYGPSWQRVVLLDLAGAAGAFFGALASTVDDCIRTARSCEFSTDRRTARFTLTGGALGIAAGWLLTRNYDRRRDSERKIASLFPRPFVLAAPALDGANHPVPGLVWHGEL